MSTEEVVVPVVEAEEDKEEALHDIQVRFISSLFFLKPTPEKWWDERQSPLRNEISMPIS